jgi:hypothetical protein
MLASVIFAIVATGEASLPLKQRNVAANNSRTTRQANLRQQAHPKEISLGDVLSGDDTLSYNRYVVEKRHRRVREDHPTKMQLGPSWIDVSYAVLKRRGRVLAKFDDNIYFGVGNDIRFGLFSFLDGPTKQLAVSQDIFREGKQWVVSLAPRPRIIFDGPDWAVGREGDDMGMIDLDHDNVFEITVPITDFYDFQDKLPISRIPLPEIIFKYDSAAGKYVPANPNFASYALRGVSDRKIEQTADELDQRAMALGNLLTLIYVSKQSQAWDFYDRSYKLADKEEIARRVKAILNRQPVYSFIYNQRSHK